MFPLALLRSLKERSYEWCSPSTLAPELGLTMARLAREVAALERSGFTIERHPYQGLRLSLEEMPLAGPELAAIHAEMAPGEEVVFKETTASTNDDAVALARRGAPEWTVVVAEHQTKGKGRMGRRWEDRRRRDLLFSVVLRPPAGVSQVSALAVPAAVAVTAGIRRLCRRRTRIKWPNDVVYRGKKLAGILVEGGRDSRRSAFLVVGVGINVCGETHLNDAISLEEICGETIDRAALFGAILPTLKLHYEALVQGNLELVEERWRSASATLGKVITIESGGRRFTGKVVHLSLRRGITLESKGGRRRNFRGERVTVLDHP